MEQNYVTVTLCTAYNVFIYRVCHLYVFDVIRF